MRDRDYSSLGTRLRTNAIAVAEIQRQEGQFAVSIAHGIELDRIRRWLRAGQSVLVECDKELSEYVLMAVSDKEKMQAMSWSQVTAKKFVPNVIPGLIETAHNELRSGFLEPNHVIVLRHLDLMCWTVDNHPRPEINDLIYWLLEFGTALKLAFWDPVFPVPRVVSRLFANRISLRSFDRSAMWELVQPDEARLLSSPSSFSIPAQARLYQHLSGTNVVEIRRILRGLLTQPFSPHPSDTSKVYDFIRSQTGMAPMVPDGAVIGYRHVREELDREVLFPVRLREKADSPEALNQADALVPRGIILEGPPGTGKSEWAKWIANRLETPLFVIHGPELKNRYVGETEAAIRAVFAQARRAAPSLILIDEIDALMPSRSEGASNFEVSMVAQLLAEMDGLRTEESVIVVGTTNRLIAIDDAFLRPGRFSHIIRVGYPDASDRDAIFRYYSESFGLSLQEGAIKELVRLTGGVGRGALLFAGDHLRAICKDLLLESLYRKQEETTPNDPNDPSLIHAAMDRLRERVRPAAPAAGVWDESAGA